MQRYFTNNKPNNHTIIIDGDDYSHITKVMRMKKGDKAYICSEGLTYLGEIAQINSQDVVFKIIKEIEEKKELNVDVCIAHGIVRREKMEEVIEKVTALGANYYLPVEMERCNAKMHEEKKDKKISRLNKIAKEAAEQSHRTRILEVLEPISFKSFLDYSKQFDILLVAYENTNIEENLKKVLNKENIKNILILIGPEGGISEMELKTLIDHHFIKVSLGPRILRTELAPVYIMSVIGYEWETR